MDKFLNISPQSDEVFQDIRALLDGNEDDGLEDLNGQRQRAIPEFIMDPVNAVTYLDVPDKSENDKKHYKTLMLANGLRALLVSDPTPVPHYGSISSPSSCYDSIEDSCDEETCSSEESESDSDEGDEKVAACSLLVDVVSFTEPAKYQGLAHFLEHMLFMGSAKYPAENAYEAHIKKCGGSDNAYTDNEQTYFNFEVPEEHLNSSMDYFSALLKAPLMKKEAMAKGCDVVESCFQQIVIDDTVSRYQLVASFATAGYPHAKFPWCNLETLEGVNNDELHEELHKFRNRYYSAHRMCVCVQARLPIDELEKMVLEHFSGIPNNNLPATDLSPFNYRDAFRKEFFEEVIFVKPVEDICKLEVTWILPSMMKRYKCKPDQFIAHLIGHEGEGSLCSYLRKKLWASDLAATIDESRFGSNSIYTSFIIRIYLTERGFKQLDEVLAATFASIKLFSNCGSLKDAYNEIQSIEATSFRYESQRSALDNVEKLAVKMKYYPPKDILTGSKLYSEYKEEDIKQVVQHLNEFRFNIMITSEQIYESISYDNVEKWFGIEYTTMKMPQKWRELWENSKPIPELFLSKPNRFISNDFRLYWEENGKPEIPAAPKKILQTDICELWFRQDDKFNLPKAYMCFYFISPWVRKDPKNDVLCALYERSLKFRLIEELYPATIAELSYQFYAAGKGFVLKVNGYNEKLHVLIEVITKVMVTKPDYISNEQFDIFKTDLKKSYLNSLIKPRTLNKDIRLSIIEYIRWPLITKYKCLDSITLMDMMNIYTDEIYVQTLMQGNLTEETAHNIINTVLTTLNCSKIKETKYIENRTVQLPQGSRFIRCHALNDKDINSVICNFYQLGPCSVRTKCILELFMKFLEKSMLDSLHNKEKLGHYMSASVRMNFSIIGYSMAVKYKETEFSAANVDEEIEALRGQMLQIIKEMSLVDFGRVRDSLIKAKQVVDISLAEEVSRNWKEITSEDYVFDRKCREIEVLRVLTKQDIIDFCLNNITTNFRKLSVQVIAHDDEVGANHSETSEDYVFDRKRRENEVLRALSEHHPIELCSNNEITDNRELAEQVVQVLDEYNDEVDANYSETDLDTPNFEEESSASSEDKSDAGSEELLKALASKLDVILIPNDDDATTITDITDFKEKLHVYPIAKTYLDNTTDPTPMEEC